MKKLYAISSMLLATLLWGFAFSAQSSGMKFVGAMQFVALRSIVGVAALVIVIAGLDIVLRKRITVWGDAVDRRSRKRLLAGGILCGVVISCASTFQQLGLLYVTAGKTGFLTALYIIIVPLLGIFCRRRTPILLWGAVLLALGGTYLLCGGVSNIGPGEIFVMICALLFALHIIIIDRFAADCDCVRLSCVQFMAATAVSAIASLIFGEKWLWENIIASLPFWVFCGIGSSAVAFTLQMFAQKYLHPAAAALIMSLESVFAVLGGWLFLNEILSWRELAGCGVILVAVIAAQLPGMVGNNRKNV